MTDQLDNPSSYLIPLNDRAFILTQGDDVRDFLQNLISNDIDNAEKDGLGFTTLLSPQGKIAYEFFLLPARDGFIIDCHTDFLETLLKRLKLYKLRAKVSLTDVSDEWGVYADIASKFGGHDDIISLLDPRLNTLGTRHYATKNILEDAFSGQCLNELSTYHAIELLNGVPALGVTFQPEKMFILDVNYDALGGVCYKKGCFVGQEVTSRMKRKGEIRKRTMIVHSDKILEESADILSGDTKIGTVMCSAMSSNDICSNTKYASQYASQYASLALIRLDRLETADQSALLSGEQKIMITRPNYL